MQRNLMASAVAVALGTIPLAATAASDADLAAIREQISQLKTQYEARIEALEKRLAAAEAAPASAGVAAANPAPHTANSAAGSFNPEIGLVLQGQWRRAQEVPERGITGFWPAAGHDHGGDTRGASIDHAELMLRANVDPNFSGQLNIAYADGSAEVEEAWFQTLGLGRGLTVKAGRFLSGVGYINEQHPHAWDFVDAPLASQVLFGEHYAQDGVQIRWLAPTDLFLEFGAEFGRGANFPGTDRNRNGSGAGAVFAHLGGDLGTSHSWRTGLSYLSTRAADRAAHFEDSAGNEVEGQFSGRSRTWIADFVWKWAPEGNARERAFKFQAEYFRRTEDGSLACSADPALLPGSACAGDPSGDYRSRQSGYYLQGVYRFAPAWRVGARFDRLDSGDIRAGLGAAGVLDAAAGTLAAYRPQRHALMLDWSASEFSRLRLQYNRDRSMLGVSDNQVLLQYQMSLGAHGAHGF